MAIEPQLTAVTVNDETWMRRAMALADKAKSEGEVPVGAVVVKDGQSVGEGWNQTIRLNDPSAHAEILALRQAGEKLGNYRMPGAVLYVTLEPCVMCAGAMIHSRIQRLVFGTPDPKTGAAGTVFDSLQDPRHNHGVEIAGPCLAEECARQLQCFFKDRREAARTQKQAPGLPGSGS
jgi:tRNA(adenine34) deaminase